MAIIDRLGRTVDGEPSSVASDTPYAGLAIKTPCKAATTANITLSGLQTIDGVALAADDRVLVKDQTDATTNGIYNVSSGNWTRADDFDGANEIVKGVVVYITDGSTNGSKQFQLTASNPIVVDSSSLTFNSASSQPLDAELTALAGLTSAADKLPYFTGSETASLADFTAFGRSLIDDADAATARTTLGVAIGTDVQAYDQELAAIAGLTSAADKGLYFTGSGTASTFDLSSYGRSLTGVANEASFKALVNLEIGIDVQAYDAELAALAGLTSAADSFPYFTGIGTAALSTVTSFARTLLDDADATTARATLGLVIGTNVQAFDSELAAISGLASAADKVPYFTGSGTAAVADFTAAGRSMAAAASAAAQTTLLSTVVGDSGAGGTKGLVPAPAAGDAAANKFLKADGTWTAPTGSGDVTGPASSTDNAAARFDLTTGKIVQNSALIIADTTGDLSSSGGGGIDIQGTNTNDSAAAGYIGEYGENTLVIASSISLTTNTAADVITVSLAAGDYDVWGVVVFSNGGSTVVQHVAAYINTTANSFPSNDSGAIGAINFGAGKTGGSASDFVVTPVVRMSLSATTTVRLGVRAIFTTSSANASGTIKWRRRR